MKVANEYEVGCIHCRKLHKVYEYEGLEGGLYCSHICNEYLKALREGRA